jgi:predicted nucleotidyltransferase
LKRKSGFHLSGPHLWSKACKRLFDFDLGLVFETLAQAEGVHRADFDAFAAGDALIGIDVGDVVRTNEGRGVEILARSQAEARAAAAVAHGVGLAIAIDVRHFVHQAIVFGFLEMA